MQGPSYLGLCRSISWLVMPCLLTSPGHHQPWYCRYRLCRSFSYLKCLSTCAKSMWRNAIKCKYMYMFPQKNLARKGLTEAKIHLVSNSGYLFKAGMTTITTNSSNVKVIFFSEFILHFLIHVMLISKSPAITIFNWSLENMSMLCFPPSELSTAMVKHHLTETF